MNRRARGNPLNQHASKKPDRVAPDTDGRRLAPSCRVLAPAMTQPYVSLDIYQDFCLVLKPKVMDQLRSVDRSLT